MPTWLIALLAIGGIAYFTGNAWLSVGYLQIPAPKVSGSRHFANGFLLFCFGVPIALVIIAIGALWPVIDARRKLQWARRNPMKLPPRWHAH